jgi:RNA polymerase sigma factor (sigma-70 family)
MQSKTDAELLRDYATTRSEAAFGEVVRRYADFVYSAAVRQVGSPEAAHDVAQTVFTHLARKSGSLAPSIVLIGWLCRAVRLAALHQLRIDRRRTERERHAMEWHQTTPPDPDGWDEIRPLLDEAIANLRDEDREAVLVRFFKDESLASVGAMLGISEDAAQKRISRALEKLRQFLLSHDITTTSAALSATLTAHAVQSAPSNFAPSVTSTVLASITFSPANPLLSTFTNMITTKAAILALLLTGGIGIMAYRNALTQRELNRARALAQSQAEEIDRLRTTNDQLRTQANEIAQLRRDARDVLRLRAEVARLRQRQLASQPLNITPAEQQTNVPALPEGPDMMIIGQFISVPTESLNTLPWANVKPGEFGLITQVEATNALTDLDGLPGMAVISFPRIQTKNGIEASLFTGEAVPINGTNADAGVSLSVNPHYSTNSPTITLEVRAQVGHAFAAPTPQNPQPSEPRATVITNFVTLSNGQSVVLSQDMEPEERLVGTSNTNRSPSTLLVLLTPRILLEQAH